MSNNVDLSEFEGDIEGLQARLADRESLVTELTKRLEQAAEQLDRLQRSGTRPNHLVGGGGSSPQLIEEQRALTEELQHAVRQWEEMQPATVLARLEMQVGEVRDLIVERLDRDALAALAAAVPSTPAGPAADQPAPAEDTGTTVDSPVEQPDGLSAYEAFKAGLADSETAESPDADSSSETSAPEEPAVVPSTFDPPEPVDFDSAGPDELREACDQRDSYIAYLTSRLRAAESKTQPAGDWSDLEGVPDELRARLEESATALEESLRLHEVATSLERARLGREANRLESLDHQLRRRARNLGVDLDGDGDGNEESPEDDPADEDTRNTRGWFGFGKKSAD
ncbi:MAG: hypothetical protein ACE5KM_15025 [Planctomycetaceae bacterium]